MDSWTTNRLDRFDRQVRNGYVHLNRRTPLHRLRPVLEDALRLTELPGENLGWVYYFRRVSLHDLPADGIRTVWFQTIQSALYELAKKAVHATDWRAATADAVFFCSYQEALELQLQRLTSGNAKQAWFWRAMEGRGSEASQGLRIARVIERLQQWPTSYVAVAQAIFHASPPLNIRALLSSIPLDRFLIWLGKLSDDDRADPSPLVVSPSAVRDILQQAVREFGVSDPRTLWLGSLAVILSSPASTNNRAAVSRVQAMLHQFADRKASPGSIPPGRNNVAPSLAGLCDEESFAGPQEISIAGPIPQMSAPAPPQAPRVDEDYRSIGKATTRAGLFFLLNALTRLGISRALESERNLGYQFVAQILQRIAAKADIDPNDPILEWTGLVSLSDGLFSDDRLPADLSCRRTIWPSNLTLPTTDCIDIARLARVWSIAVRRWCWRRGRLRISEIVNRSGQVSLSRSDLDVFLPLGAVDVRIRSIGLDIDPGWLPWFGRVVRFHYTQPESGVLPC